MKRLLTYLKGHTWTMVLATLLVLGVIVTDLYRPIILGNAIDDYINAYDRTWQVTSEGADGAVVYGDLYLTNKNLNVDTSDTEVGCYYQLFLYQDVYYMAEEITGAQTEELRQADSQMLAAYAATAAALSRAELQSLRANDFRGILAMAGLYLLMLGLGFALNYGSTWMLQRLGQNIVYRLREEVFAHIQSLHSGFFDVTPVGKLVTRVSNDTEAINELFSTVLAKLFKNMVLILGYAVVMLSINARLAMYAFLLLPFVTVLTLVFRGLSRRAYQLVRNRITDLNTFLSEHLSGMQLIQMFVQEEGKYREFEEKSNLLYLAYRREVWTFAIFRPAVFLLSIAAKVIIVGVGSYFVLGNTLSLGTLYVFITYISSFFQPIEELAEQFGTLQSSLASAEKIFNILDEKPKIVNPCLPEQAFLPRGGEPAPRPEEISLDCPIEFRNVWFAYNDEDYVLKDISFTIQPGEKVAFVGATGAGKTSILNLIGRYYDIQKGQILIGGVDIREYNTDVLRRAIGQVQQDVFLFAGDIGYNISLGRADITPEMVEENARIVRADGFIRQLPGGYASPVTERGSPLSTGQRQLISFARTLASQPTILVLDEATANIDTETESLITQALEVMMEGRTTIMVAHRLSTIQHADKIFVMHHGEIWESGTHQELLARDGLYKKLYELQLVEE